MAPRIDHKSIRYHTREVRDLAWACFAPPLMLSAALPGAPGWLNNCGLALTPERSSWLQALDEQPAPLLEFLQARHNQRLGLYYESLWQFFLGEDPAVELLAHNLPVRDGGRTVGEFDCLYYCRERRANFHLELAVKYYLGYTQEQQTPAWLGPNSHDRLDIKVARLLTHQARLSRYPAAAELLHERGIHTPHCEVEIKGYLFRPTASSVAPPSGFNPENSLRPWVSVEALERYLADSAAGPYRILQRLQWLAPSWQADSGPLLDSGELITQLQNTPRPQLVAALGADGWEQQRFFVTPGGWPGLQVDATGANQG